MNAKIELHDSKLAEIAQQGGTVIVYFQPAYLHKSVGRPGLDPGSGWVQNARLVFSHASVNGGYPELPCDVEDGELVVGGTRYPNEIPVPFETAEPVELNLTYGPLHRLVVIGTGVRLELIGEAKYVEEFRPR